MLFIGPDNFFYKVAMLHSSQPNRPTSFKRRFVDQRQRGYYDHRFRTGSSPVILRFLKGISPWLENGFRLEGGFIAVFRWTLATPQVLNSVTDLQRALQFNGPIANKTIYRVISYDDPNDGKESRTNVQDNRKI